MVGLVAAVEVQAWRAIEYAGLRDGIGVAVAANLDALSEVCISEGIASGLVAVGHAGVSRADIRIESRGADLDAFVELRVGEVYAVAFVDAPESDRVAVGPRRAGQFAGEAGVQFVHIVGACLVGPYAFVREIISEAPGVVGVEGVVPRDAEDGARVVEADLDAAPEGRAHADSVQLFAPAAVRTRLDAFPAGGEAVVGAVAFADALPLAVGVVGIPVESGGAGLDADWRV